MTRVRRYLGLKTEKEGIGELISLSLSLSPSPLIGSLEIVIEERSFILRDSGFTRLAADACRKLIHDGVRDGPSKHKASSPSPEIHSASHDAVPRTNALNRGNGCKNEPSTLVG